MTQINNPILKGFNPDPSIIRVGENYYIATSTFEWFPGVQIHYSKDLVNWELITRPLNRVSQINMRGIPSSGGVWAPCLSFDNGVFYLCYTLVINHDGLIWNAHNYLVTADDIMGEWSDPIYLNSDGFDPSLFHDEDGRKWVVNRSLDYRNKNYGISLQEYSIQKKKLIGKSTIIFKESDIGDAEGPHLYKHNGFYYLIVAEGGTMFGHCVTMARSKDIRGIYEVHPRNPILTSKDDIFLDLQKAGHADIIETENGDWYMVHLCARPLATKGVCPLGRETAIQKVEWSKDNWLDLSNGGNKPFKIVQVPNEARRNDNSRIFREDFNSSNLNIHFQTLRSPLKKEQLSLEERPGFLRLIGKEFLNSCFEQSLIARRQQDFCYTAKTCVEFEPASYKHMAGLVCYYSTHCFYYLKISYHEEIGKCIEIISCDNDSFNLPLKEPINIDNWLKTYLKVVVEYDRLQFFCSSDDVEWIKVGPVLDASILSDDHILLKRWAFTGAFVGICCQDLLGSNKHADFDWFEYIEHNKS